MVGAAVVGAAVGWDVVGAGLLGCWPGAEVGSSACSGAVGCSTSTPRAAAAAAFSAAMRSASRHAWRCSSISTLVWRNVADVQQVLPFIFRLGFYASGVLFNVEAYVETHRWMFDLNPMYCFITINRWAVLGGELDPVIVASIAVWTVVIAMAGVLWFRRGEDRYGRD